MKSRLRMNRIFFTLLIIFLMVFFIVFFLTKDNDVFPISTDNIENIELFNQNGLTLLRTDNQLYVLDKHANTKEQITLPDGDCLFTANGAYILTGDLKDNTVSLYKKGTQIGSVRLSGTIRNIFLNNKGGLCVISEENFYMSKLTAYNNRLKELMQYSHDERFFLSAHLAPNQKSIAIALADYTGQTLNSEVRIYDITDDQKLLWNRIYEDELIAGLSFADNGRLSMLTDRRLELFKNDGTSIFSRDFTGKTITFGEYRNDKYFFLAFENGTATDFEIYNEKGNLTGSFSVSDAVSDVCMTGKHLFLYSADAMYRINSKGIIKASSPVDTLITDSILCHDGKTVIDVSNNLIRTSILK